MRSCTSALAAVMFALAICLIVANQAYAAEYTSPRALSVGDTYVLVIDAFTGDEATTQPKTDANDGKNGDNPYFRRHNVARAHLDYWYTSAHQNPGEPDPSGPQWVDYTPPLNILGAGRYRIVAEYRVTDARATYPALYKVNHIGGTTVIERSQRVGSGWVSFSLGDYDLGSTGWVRVEDTGGQSITFNKMKFTLLEPSEQQLPDNLLFQESFLTDPFAGRWSKDIGTPGVDAGNVIYTNRNGVNDPDSNYVDGHVYYSNYGNAALGPQQITYLGDFTTAGESNVLLSFYIRNGATPGGTLTVQTQDAGGVWQTVWSESDLEPHSSWTRIQVPLTSVATGIRFYFDVARTRLDEIVIETYEDAPAITEHPVSREVCLEDDIILKILAIGSGTLNYQWQKNGSNLSDGGRYSGVTTNVLTISNAEIADSGNYRCVVTNNFGTVTSNAAAIDVVECVPQIELSASKRFLTYNGQTIMMVGDSGTQCVPQNKNLNYRQWIDDCADGGIRAIHVWSFLVPRQKQDGSTYEARWGYVIPALSPWARKTSGPLAKDQLRHWDLTKFDESPGGYWDRMRDMCDYAKSKNITVGITVFFGWAKWPSTWEYHPFNVDNGGHLTDNMAPQTIASPGTEVWQQTWSDTWSNAKKTQWVWERFSIKLINELGSKGNVWFAFMDEHSYTEGNCGDHFRDFFKSRGMLWADWDQRRSTIDMVYEQPSGDDKNSGTLVYTTKKPYRPFLMLEKEPYTGDGVRTAIWTVSIAGGHYYYHNDERQETVQTGIMGYDPNVQNSDRAANQLRRDWLGYASRFFNEHVTYLDELYPSNSLCSSGIYALAYPGKEYVVYAKLGSSSSFTVDLSAASGTLACRFYNPRNGNFRPTFYVNGGGVRTFNTPNDLDWVLHIWVEDEEPPSVPTNVTATAQSETSIQVTWTASTDNVGVEGYKIFRNGVHVGTSETTIFLNTGLSPATTYSYTVLAYDTVGNESAQSSPPAVATTPDNTPPTVPTNVTATAQSETSVQVNWTASTDNVGVTGYKIFRNGTEVGTSGTPGFLSTDLQAGTTYSYTVSAFDAAGNNSAQSSPPAVTTTPDNTPPSVPSNVQAAALLPTSVEVTWTASTDNVGVTGYKIFRDGNLAGTSGATSYADTVLDPGITYSYTVSAYDAAGNDSPQSSVALVTTPLGMSIGAAKSLADATPVFLVAKIVSAIFDDCIYVKEPDDPKGIKVFAIPLPPGLLVGKMVDVAGTIETSLPEYERYIAGTITLK